MALTETSAEPGALIREWRRRRKLSQLELAERAEVSARHLSFVENGRARPSRGLLLRLSDHLGVPVQHRSTLLVAAGYAPLRPPPGRAAVLEGIGGHLPPPAGESADTCELAVAAGRRALASSGSVAAGAVVLATATPDAAAPTAPRVAARLGLGGVAAFDVAAVCSGFLYGLASAAGLVTSGAAERVLLVAADRAAAGAPGGAAAVVLRAGHAREAGAVGRVVLGSDGEQDERADADASRHTAERVYAASLEALDTAGWSARDIDQLAAPRGDVAKVLREVAERLCVPPERRLPPAGDGSPTGAAAVPLLLARAAAEGALGAGHRVLLAAFGDGLTWGATALRWPRVRSQWG
ncbi:3-oxoacyl-[acyl-carrier-protein] synthase III C-terminal domain-containing protein [Streptomyces litchfieldiae]|uniref:3-oxoacyl-[acyl-carrier-protein] synthase III C-terminal domain-containing protein n=1 Tax=Streptomyces litchfieldiae TaxID=3075543 RepID=A0ABU2N0Y3_9ACTN|nr:3-oxoacyl-[acyl-carrier-protein] synthase III C-terminal domain-containing protein [Streptomyces sp. DSM 44938]MDT0346419.1 3-oxoacyl-[acyl-carrier-protein] synthase III C-terminal domain-containing protein [Streptomyces sp. DSM 44938]